MTRETSSSTNRTYDGSLVLPRLGTGARYGESVSIRIDSIGIAFATSLISCAFLNVIIPEKEIKNPLGTEGRLVQAWAKLITEMWKNSNQVVRPDLFKRILGQYNVTFEGYG